MNVKKLKEILNYAPNNMEVEIFGINGDFLTPLDECWIPEKQDMLDGNTAIQLTTFDYKSNKGREKLIDNGMHKNIKPKQYYKKHFNKIVKNK
jgi:hypothetical protein